jgi:hypothetical protein
MPLDWQTPVDDLNALTVSGADEKNRDLMVGRLTDAGTLYDAARTALGTSAVDAAQAAGDAAFEQAGRSFFPSSSYMTFSSTPEEDMAMLSNIRIVNR